MPPAPDDVVAGKGTLVSLDKPGVLMARHGRKRLRVSFAAPLPGDLPPPLLALGATLDAARTTCECVLPSDAGGPGLGPLLAAMAALPGIIDVRTEQPSLEQVFLHLVGDA